MSNFSATSTSQACVEQQKIAPFLSVVIPVYNGERFLREAIQSVLLQPCRDLMVVVVNDGSTDHSLEVALDEAAKDSRVVVINQENSGVSVARNAGIERCLALRSQHIAFLDADDIWVADFYTDARKQELQQSEAELFRFSVFDANEAMTRGHLREVKNSTFLSPSVPLFAYSFCGFIYSAKFFSDYSIRFPIGYKVQEDTAFLFLVLSSTACLKSYSSPIFCYRSNGGSICHAKRDPKLFYFGHIIPIWDWVKSELNRLTQGSHEIQSRAINSCETMKKTYLVEFICAACMYGYSVAKIKSCIRESGLEHYFLPGNTVWVDKQSSANWNTFHAQPHRFYVKYRLLGTTRNIAKYFRNFKLVQRRRYPQILAKYLSPSNN